MLFLEKFILLSYICTHKKIEVWKLLVSNDKFHLFEAKTILNINNHTILFSWLNYFTMSGLIFKYALKISTKNI